MIKLNAIAEADYEKYGKILDDHLKALPPKKLKLSLDTLFEDTSEVLEFKANECAGAALPYDEWDTTYSFWFNIDWDKEGQRKLAELARTKELNREMKRKLRRYYYCLKDKDPVSMQDVLDLHDDDADVFRHLTTFWYDVRYYSSHNSIYIDDLYSGKLKGQGLLCYFFESIGKVIDFEDLDCIILSGVVERRTKNMFEKLKSRPNAYISEQLQKKYVKSPFLRVFNRVGLRDMTIYTDNRDLCIITGKKSDVLKFSVEEYKNEF